MVEGNFKFDFYRLPLKVFDLHIFGTTYVIVAAISIVFNFFMELISYWKSIFPEKRVFIEEKKNNGTGASYTEL